MLSRAGSGGERRDSVNRPGVQPIPVLPRPDWLRVRFPTGPNYLDLKNIIRSRSLHTVCEEAHCPNIGECWEHRTATLMILGRICTRACRFCAVTTGLPVGVDEAEPERVAEAVDEMGLRHAVITSVARDDLPDGGARIFAETIRAIRRRRPSCSVEVLIPDFGGSEEALRIVMDARPDILNHNIETVRRLQRKVRARAFYERSLEVLRRAKEMVPDALTKSGMMLGLGETREEIREALRDLRAVGCDIVTIGQYLQPSPFHLPIVRYVPPAEFAEIKAEGMAMGFRHVEAGPLVRSSYHAHEQVQRATAS
ncbi:MAG: lipoyl synthase [Chloroflexi bacterium]|nr:lipoyl synthase [Chloroflexota bacterium]